MIHVKELKKTYKMAKKQQHKEHVHSPYKEAVRGISFHVQKGEIFGLLGPNGAGKTTTLRCISTLIKPSAGTVRVQSHDVVTAPSEVRRRIAFLTNELKLDPHFTPAYTMLYFGRLYGMSDEEIIQRRKVLFTEFGISEFRDTKIQELSTGMKQKLSIAVSLVHDPEIIIFDEPTNGLDIITAKAVTDYLMKLKEMGRTIVISTHIMTVAAKMCDRIGILIGGRLVTLGTLEGILKATGCEDLEDAFFKYYVNEMGGMEANA